MESRIQISCVLHSLIFMLGALEYFRQPRIDVAIFCLVFFLLVLVPADKTRFLVRLANLLCGLVGQV